MHRTSIAVQSVSKGILGAWATVRTYERIRCDPIETVGWDRAPTHTEQRTKHSIAIAIAAATKNIGIIHPTCIACAAIPSPIASQSRFDGTYRMYSTRKKKC
eukprot:jgi/Psemu1/308342/fgenesh1_kg.402_\